MPGCRLSSAEVLRDIVELLDGAAEHAPSKTAVLVRIDRLPTTPEDEVQFSLKRLGPGVHPLTVLDGFVAPPTWAGIGVIAWGKARSLDDPSRVTGRARVIVVAVRDGTLASGLKLEGTDLHVRIEQAGAGVLGDIPLALCRSLGIPCVSTSSDGAPEGDKE